MYMQQGPCQPHKFKFSLSQFGEKRRRFNKQWFKKYSNWLEYSESKDAAYCLCCYLFRPCYGDQSGGDSFVGKGFKNWRNSKRLQVHVGGFDSAHHMAWRDFEAMNNLKQNIEHVVAKKTSSGKKDYRIRLKASVRCVRWLLQQGLALRGHDESEESRNHGNFLEFLQYTAEQNPAVKAVALQNASKNLKLTSSDIQKDIVHAMATLIVKTIIDDIGDSLFSILVDESRDISTKEQMAVVLRYVDRRGQVLERFVGIVHVSSTTAISLKKAIDHLFSKLGLSISRLLGQGYDGASNMQGTINGLKTLILQENPSAFYIHCFAHQLQLALVYVAKHHTRLDSLFWVVGEVVNTINASPKRSDALQDIQVDMINREVESGERATGRGLNQQTALIRHGDTRWGSYHGTLIRLLSMFSSTVGVLQKIIDDPSPIDQKGQIKVLSRMLQSFEIIFGIHLMVAIFGITNNLSKSLQRQDQDIVNAMTLVRICKERLQTMRESGWEPLLDKVLEFCKEHEINIPKMDDFYTEDGKSRRNAPKIKNYEYYRFDIFTSVIDMQLQELNGRFNEVSTDLLLCIACLCPDNSFDAFDKEKLLKFAKYYPEDFSSTDLIYLDDELANYIFDVTLSDKFQGLKGIGALASKMVQTKKSVTYSYVYKLITLALILPVATATVERVFSAMNIIKTRLQNRMGDQWMNDSMLVYIERDISISIDEESVMQHFQKMKSRRHILY